MLVGSGGRGGGGGGGGGGSERNRGIISIWENSAGVHLLIPCPDKACLTFLCLGPSGTPMTCSGTHTHT